MLQARGVDAYIDTSPIPPTATEENPFPYGWRYVTKRLPTGEEVHDQIPLTTYDLLNPQLDDQVPQRDEHFQLVVDLVASLKTHYTKDPSMGVFSDLIMDWGISGLSKPAPDIAVVPHIKRKHIGRDSFNVAQEGTRPCLIIEVMSPEYPGDDTDKMDIYSQAGVAEYFLIEPYLVQEVPHYELRGYRLEQGVYRQIAADDRGRVLSQTLQLWFEVENQGRQVRMTEVRIGRRLLTQVETEEARLQEQQARLAAEARADAEAKARAELEQRLRELENLLNSRT
jgi:Uma2 family endonuclease